MSFAIDASTLACFGFDEVSASNGLADRASGGNVPAVNSPAALQSGPYSGKNSRGFNGSSQAFDTSAFTDARPTWRLDATLEMVLRSENHAVSTRVPFFYGHFNDWYCHLRYNPAASTGLVVSFNNDNTGSNFQLVTTSLLIPVDTWCLIQVRKTVTSGTTAANRLNRIDVWVTSLAGTFSQTPGYTLNNVLNPNATTHSPHYHIGRWGGPNDSYFNGKIAGVRISTVARTALELQDSFTRWQGVVTDITKPAVANLSPTPGTALQKTQPVSLEVTDVGGLRRVMVVASFPGLDLEEVVHNGTSWGPRYSLAPNARTAITNGYRFTVLRRGGWPAPPTLTAYAVDTAGNEAA